MGPYLWLAAGFLSLLPREIPWVGVVTARGCRESWPSWWYQNPTPNIAWPSRQRCGKLMMPRSTTWRILVCNYWFCTWRSYFDILWVLFVWFHLFDHLFFERIFCFSFQLFYGSLWTGVGAISLGSFWRCFLHEEWLKLWAKKNCPEPCSLRKFGWTYEVWPSSFAPDNSFSKCFVCKTQFEWWAFGKHSWWWW